VIPLRPSEKRGKGEGGERGNTDKVKTRRWSGRVWGGGTCARRFLGGALGDGKNPSFVDLVRGEKKEKGIGRDREEKKVSLLSPLQRGTKTQSHSDVSEGRRKEKKSGKWKRRNLRRKGFGLGEERGKSFLRT